MNEERIRQHNFVQQLLDTKAIRVNYAGKLELTQAYSHFVHWLNDPNVASIACVAFTASGKSTLLERLKELDKIYNDDKPPLYLVSFTFGDLRASVMQDWKISSTSSLTEDQWEQLIVNTYINRRDMLIKAAFKAPFVLYMFSEYYGPPGKWTVKQESDFRDVLNIVTETGNHQEATEKFKEQVRILISEEFPIMTEDSKMRANKALCEGILKDAEETGHTKVAVIFPDPNNIESAIHLRGYFKENYYKIMNGEITNEEVQQQFPFIDFSKVDLVKFLHSQVKSAPKKSIINTYDSLSRHVSKLFGIRQFKVRQMLLEYRSRLSPDFYQGMSYEDQLKYMDIDSFIQLFINDICHCKSALFVYNRPNRNNKLVLKN